MKDDKCREAWEKFYDSPPSIEATNFATQIEVSNPDDKWLAIALYAGYHARKAELPSVEKIMEVIELAEDETRQDDYWLDNKIMRAIAERIRLLVGEEGSSMEVSEEDYFGEGAEYWMQERPQEVATQEPPKEADRE